MEIVESVDAECWRLRYVRGGVIPVEDALCFSGRTSRAGDPA